MLSEGLLAEDLLAFLVSLVLLLRNQNVVDGLGCFPDAEVARFRAEPGQQAVSSLFVRHHFLSFPLQA